MVKTYILLFVAIVGNIALKQTGCDPNLANGLTAVGVGLTIIAYGLWVVSKSENRPWRVAGEYFVTGIYAILVGVLFYFFDDIAFWLILVLGVAITAVHLSFVRALRRAPASRK